MAGEERKEKKLEEQMSHAGREEGTHRSWKGTQEWQKPVCVSNERVWRRVDCFPDHFPSAQIAKRKMRGWMRRRLSGLLPALILLFHNLKFFLSEDQMEYFSITLAGKMI